jgi:hypothetical protein
MTAEFVAATEGLRRLPQADVIEALRPLLRPVRFSAGTWGSGEGEGGIAPSWFDDAGNRYATERIADWNGVETVAYVTRWLTPAFDPDYAGGVFGTYVGRWRPDGTPVDIVFRQQERHGGFVAENLEWIGPLAVAAFAFFGPGLLAPYQAAGTAAGGASPGAASMLDDFANLPPGETWLDPTANLPPGETWFDPSANLPPGEYWDVLPPGGDAPFPPSWDVLPPPTTVPPGLPPPTMPPLGPPAAPGPGWTVPGGGSILRDIGGLVRDSTNIARQVLSTVQTVRAIRDGGTGIGAGGRTRIVRADGTIYTVGPDGRPRIERGAPGVAEPTPDGGFIVNNGDGTYTRIGPDGRRQVLRYGGAGPGASGLTGAGGLLSNPWIMVGAAAVGGLLLARTMRR